MLRPRSALIFILFGCTCNIVAGAATVTWPGLAPCNTSLQACVDAVADGDTVEIATDSPIDEHPQITQRLTLRGAAGFDPRFAAFKSILASTTGSAPISLTVEDLEFVDGGIRMVNNGTADATLTVRRVRINRTSGFSAVVASSGNSGALNVRVENCDISVTGSELLGGRSGIEISSQQSADVAIRFNRIVAQNIGQRSAIDLFSGNGNVIADITGNRIEGLGFNSGIQLIDDYPAGSLTAFVTSNAITGQRTGAGRSSAISVSGNDGTVEIHVINNTLNGNDTGISIGAHASLGGVVSGSLKNNIVANNARNGIIVDPDFDGAPFVVNNNNLLYRNGPSFFTEGASTLHERPLFANDGIRVYAGSPAIEAGDTTAIRDTQGRRGFPLVDVDGLRRIKYKFVDIGAYEEGNATRLHVEGSGSVSHISPIDWPRINGSDFADLLFTQNWNPPGSSGIYNDAYTGIYYAGGTWRVFNEDFVDVPQHAAFNLFNPDDFAVFGHLTTTANQAGFATTLDNSAINGESGKILLVGHNWNGYGSPGTYFDAPFGVTYFGPTWLLINFNDELVPENAAFTIYSQDSSQSAFRYVARAGDISGNLVKIDRPLLNGKRCAEIQVTQGSGAARNPHPIGVFYSSSAERWTVFNQDSAPMPVGAEFHVLFDPAQIDFCSGDLLFLDGFE